MDFHIFRKLPSANAATEREGTSLAVVQFMDLVRGRRERREPDNPFLVGTVKAEERYCLECKAVHWSDVVRDPSERTLLIRCRACRKDRLQ